MNTDGSGQIWSGGSIRAISGRTTWVPLEATERTVTVLIDNPHSSEKLQDIKRLFPGKTISCSVGLREDIIQYVNAVTTDLIQGNSAESLRVLMDQMSTQDQGEQSDDPPEPMDENSSIIVRLVNQIITDAYKAGASDIHIEPDGEKYETRIRFRVDGYCYEYLKVPAAYRQSLVSRLKILAHLDIAERRKPQDARSNFDCPIKKLSCGWRPSDRRAQE